MKRGHNATNRWLCVEGGIYFGFYNEQSNVYLGHDGKWNIRATARALRGWEQLIPRHHHEGGYELISPHWDKRSIIAAHNCTTLVRQEGGQTLWVFEECEKRVPSDMHAAL
jgi:hypothetical protein